MKLHRSVSVGILILVCLFCASALSQTSTAVHDNWLHYRHDAQRTGYNSLENVINVSNVSKLKVKWVVDNAGPDPIDDPQLFIGSPAVASGRIFAGWADYYGVWGGVTAYRAGSGEMLWDDEEWRMWGPYPTVASGLCMYGGFWGMSAAKVTTGEYVGGIPGYEGMENMYSPAVKGNIVYIAGNSGTVYAYNFETWAQVWTKSGLDGHDVTLGGDKLFIGGSSMAALSLSTGERVWRTKCPNGCGTPAFVDGVLYAPTYSDGHMNAYSATNGGQLWSFSTTNGYPTEAAVANGKVYLGDGDYWSDPPAGTLYALNASTGKKIWSVRMGHSVSVPIVANGVVYATTSDGYIHAFNATNGHELWNYPDAGAIPVPGVNPGTGGFVVTGGMLYVEAGTKLYAFGL